MIKRTLVEALEAVSKIDSKGITFVHSEAEERFISYRDFSRKVREISTKLASYKIRPGDEMVFQVDDEEIFLTIFWACLIIGIIPIPLAMGTNEESKLRILKVWECLKNPFLLIGQSNYHKLKEDLINRLEAIESKLIMTEELNQKITDKEVIESVFTDNEITPETTAFIQFSSGSTGEPKGVVLSHKNLLTNINDILSVTQITPKDSSLSWMPLTHDMGIIGFHLSPLVQGINQFIIPTTLFIRQPILWVKKIDEHRITNTASPNFGYKHFLTHFKRSKTETLDLSCVKIIFNGAEPISEELCREFLQTLSRFKLKETSIFPSYGLAEASLAVSLPKVGEEIQTIIIDRCNLSIGDSIKQQGYKNTDSITFIELGFALRSTAIRITDDNDSVLPENTIGHIQIRGDNVTIGYYCNPDASEQAFTKDGWLRTGDIGFIRNNRLTWTGRAKDIIFYNGQNYYSHDLERIVEQIEDIELGRVAAVGIANEKTQQDDVVFFVSYKKKDLEEFSQIGFKIKEKIATQLGIKVDNVIPIDKIPKTTSGKPRRFKLAQQYKDGSFDAALKELSRYIAGPKESPDVARLLKERDRSLLVSIIINEIENILGYKIKELDKSFLEMGIDSIKVPQVRIKLENLLNIYLPVSIALDYPNINKLSDYIYDILFPKPFDIDINKANFRSKQSFPGISQIISGSIAIIGIGCRFPGGADNPELFWRNLEEGVDSIAKIPQERWDNKKFFDPTGKVFGKISTEYGGFLSEIDKFDPLFFGITPLEAQYIDPQQRLLLEVSYEAMENAGLNIKKLENSKTGVFIGISNHDYIERLIDQDEDIGNYTFTGSMLSTASGRISYTFGLQGPTMSIDTACSSSLVSVHQAILSLRNCECDMALAGGVNLILSPKGYIGFSRLNVLAPDGKCKSFDDLANGYGRSEGCGIIVLKRFPDAIKDRDTIYALILGSATNHDGKSSGLTVPNGLAQELVIRDALKNSGIKPEDVDYVEAHGSGTKLGDPQEVQALANVFKGRANKLLIGSVKTNIGHTESAAGIAGMIKVILALNKGKIPKQIHCQIPNSYVRWDDIPIQIAKEMITWESSEKPRIAGISSFSISGTNAHLILQETLQYPFTRDSATDEVRDFHIFSISAKSQHDLLGLIKKYISFLSNTDEETSNICYTSNTSRTCFDRRFSVVTNSNEHLKSALSRYIEQPSRFSTFTSPDRIPPNTSPVFMFTGQGSIYPGMAKVLYDKEPTFREAFDRCDSLFQQYIRISLQELLYKKIIDEQTLMEPLYAQPIIFTIEYALNELWQNWGIIPSAVVGHSIGEYVAAQAAGVFSLEDAIKLVAIRGQLMHGVPKDGKMVGILTRESVVRQIIKPFPDVSIAAVNASENVTLSGKRASVDEILTHIKNQGVFIEKLNISHAFHSVLMEPYIKPFKNEIASIALYPPKVTFISTITGKKATEDDICNHDYWAHHISRTVLFYEAIKNLKSLGYYIFLEIGGNATLSGLANQCIVDNQARFLPSLRPGRNPYEQLFSSLSKLYLIGYDIDWDRFHLPFINLKKKTVLPNYLFHKERHWKDIKNKVQTVNATEMPSLHQECDFLSNTTLNVGTTPPPMHTGPLTVDQIKSELKEIINIISGLKPEDIRDDTDLFSFGLDSLLLLEMRNEIREKYRIDIAINEFLSDLTNLNNIAGYIAAHNKTN